VASFSPLGLPPLTFYGFESPLSMPRPIGESFLSWGGAPVYQVPLLDSPPSLSAMRPSTKAPSDFGLEVVVFLHPGLSLFPNARPFFSAQFNDDFPPSPPNSSEKKPFPTSLKAPPLIVFPPLL